MKLVELIKLIESKTGKKIIFENNSDAFYIEYLNFKDNFKKTKVKFETFEKAKVWGKKNLGNFNIDMIKQNNK